MAVKKFWKLAVYKTDRLLGGHEEGGWYYTAGERLKEGKLSFSDPKKAFRACRLFNKLFGNKWNSIEYGIECDVYYRGTPDSFPKQRPYYS